MGYRISNRWRRALLLDLERHANFAGVAPGLGHLRHHSPIPWLIEVSPGHVDAPSFQPRRLPIRGVRSGAELGGTRPRDLEECKLDGGIRERPIVLVDDPQWKPL